MKKKRKIFFLFFLILLLCISQLNMIQGKEDDNQFTLTYYFDQPSVTTIQRFQDEYQRINLKDCRLYGKEGYPNLPVKPLRILLPQSAEIKKITVEPIRETYLDTIINQIELGIKSVPLNSKSLSFERPTIQYNTQEIYPQDTFNLIGIQYYRGYSILHINLHPVLFHTEEQQISYFQEMKITIQTTQSSQNPMYRGLSCDLNHVLLNTDAHDFTILESYLHNEVKQTNQQETYEYIIITTEEFAQYQGTYDFNDLLNFRQQQGLSGQITTIEEIYQLYQGKDKPEKIRNFIKDAYLNWQTSWILLAGDVEYVPVRNLWDIDGADIGMASDIYYQCLDGDFNSDNDTWYGEKKDGVNGGLIDLYAEVDLGRASVDNYEQIENFVRKTLTYESYQWGIDEHLETAESVGEFVWGGNGGWGAGYVERCIDYCDDYGQYTHGISSKQYTIKERYERDSRYDKNDLIADINYGVNFINHLGHSNPTYCMQFNPKEIFELNNDKYAFWYSQGCHPGQFQAADECIAEAWTVAEHGGFAAIMNTGYGYGSLDNYDGPDNRFAREFWDALNNSEEQISRIGQANQDSKEDNIWHIDDGNHMYHNYYSTSLFGDPYVQIKGMEDFRADFSWDSIFPKPYDQIQFRDQSFGAISLNWDFDDGTTSTERNPKHIFEDEGTYLVTLKITGENNQVDSITRTIQILDNWPPISVPYPSYISSDIPTITFQGENSWDPDGTVVSYHWDFDDNAESDEILATHTFSQDGIYNVSLTVIDDKGKQGLTSCDVRIDQDTPPVTNAIIGGERGKNDWLIGPAYISLQSSDWSGIKRIKYSLDQLNWLTYKNPITVSENGEKRIYYYAEDIWGTTEEIKETTFSIDTQKPLISVLIEGFKENHWYTSPVTITCSADDNTSGIDSIYYKINEFENNWETYNNPINLEEDGRYTIDIFTEDKAGLTSDLENRYQVAIDQKPPETSCIIAGNPSPGGFIRLILNANDEGIGVKESWYSIDDGPSQKYTTPIEVVGDGDHKISYYSIDYLDHIEPLKETLFSIGQEPALIIQKPQPGFYINDDLIFDLSNQIICLGSISIEATVTPSFMSLQSFDLLIDNIIHTSSTTNVISFYWDETRFGTHCIQFQAEFIDYTLNDEIDIIKIF